MKPVAVVGHLCLDLRPGLPREPSLVPGRLVDIGPLVVELGGSVANTGRVLAALGIPVTGHAALGDDDLGRIAIDRLAGLPRFRFHPSVVAASTSYSIVIEPDGVDRAFWHHAGANGALDLAAVDLNEAGLVHFGYPSLMPHLCLDEARQLAAFFGTAVAQGRLTSLDFAAVDPASPAGGVNWEALLARMLPVTDIASPSYDDLAPAIGLPTLFTPQSGLALAEHLVDGGAAVAAVSGGAAGMALAAAGAGRLERLARLVGLDPRGWAGAREVVPARPLHRQATTTGAGDAASAGLLAGLLRGMDAGSALKFAEIGRAHV